jgi:hypothetical protein
MIKLPGILVNLQVKNSFKISCGGKWKVFRAIEKI